MATSYESYGLKKFMGREYMGMMRHTFVIDADGKLELIYRKVKADTADQILTDLGSTEQSHQPCITRSSMAYIAPFRDWSCSKGASPPQPQRPTALVLSLEQTQQRLKRASLHRLHWLGNNHRAENQAFPFRVDLVPEAWPAAASQTPPPTGRRQMPSLHRVRLSTVPASAKATRPASEVCSPPSRAAARARSTPARAAIPTKAHRPEQCAGPEERMVRHGPTAARRSDPPDPAA